MWTKFSDAHSGGGPNKIPGVAIVIIEAPRDEAIEIFIERYKRDPFNVTCECCGEDYSVREEEGSLAEVTAFYRGCEFSPEYVERPATRYAWFPYQTLDEYLSHPSVVVIRAQEESRGK